MAKNPLSGRLQKMRVFAGFGHVVMLWLKTIVYSALKLAAAGLRHVAGTKWGTRQYLDMNRLAEASEAARRG